MLNSIDVLRDGTGTISVELMSWNAGAVPWTISWTIVITVLSAWPEGSCGTGDRGCDRRWDRGWDRFTFGLDLFLVSCDTLENII